MSESEDTYYDEIEKLKEEVNTLKEENAKLRAIIVKLNDSIASKNRAINKMQYDSWDDVSFERDR